MTNAATNIGSSRIATALQARRNRRLDERPRRVLRAEQPFSIAVGDEQQPVVGGQTCDVVAELCAVDAIAGVLGLLRD